jgi:FG-GAP-like repeat/Abnormal spindle-like microcephaly-assoc'd, ASPM-SPD-2-Hydin
MWPSALPLCLLVVLVQSATAQFETRSTTGTNVAPGSVVTADFNRDGKMDIAVASSGGGGVGNSPEVQVFLGNGDGTFASPQAYDVGPGSGPLAVSDLNGDGNPDLVVINGACPNNLCSDSLSVLFGNGDGTFQAPVNYDTPPSPVGIVLGDFNGDGKLDIATLDQSDSTGSCSCVAVLIGNGDGTFQEPAIITPLAASPEALAAGYFTSERTLDLAVTLSQVSGDTVQILLGNGDGTFQLGDSYDVGPESQSIIAADLRGDNKVDLAVGEFEGLGVAVLLGNANGTFQQPVEYQVYFANGLAAADTNGDGILDLVAGSDGPKVDAGHVSVLLGKGNGTFRPAVSYAAGEFPSVIAVADFNGDSKPDITVADQSGDSEYVLLNSGSVVFSPTSPLTFPTQLVSTSSTPLTATLTNHGTAPLRISSVTFTGKAFKGSSSCEGSIAPGKSCTITATFTPTVQGAASGTATIKDSASSKPQFVDLIGTATVVKFSPTKLSFAPQSVGTSSAPQSIEVTNTGKSILSFTGLVYVGGTDYNDFSQKNDCRGTLKAGASCTVTVTFIPLKTGTRTANVTVPDSGGGSPQTVQLSGTGD